MCENDTLTIPAEIRHLPAVLSFVEGHLEKAGCSMKDMIRINVAVEEIFVNIANYAYADKNGQAAIRMKTDPEEHIVEIEFRDSGIPFDPLAKPDPDTSLSADDRKIGGLGIFMAKKNMDEMIYTREDGQNILTIRKKL